MSLETVVEDIREQARARAEEIRAEADARAEDILDQAREDAEQIRREAEAEAAREIEQEREQQLSSANLEAKQERLEARRNVLDTVYEDVRTSIADMDGDQRRELTAALLDAAAQEFDDPDNLNVYGRSDDTDLLESLVEDRTGFEVAGTIDCLGGVVVESDAERVRVNNTFDSILDAVWEDNLREVSAQLFDQ